MICIIIIRSVHWTRHWTPKSAVLCTGRWCSWDLIDPLCLPWLPLFSLHSYFLSTEGSPRRRQLYRFALHSEIIQYQLWQLLQLCFRCTICTNIIYNEFILPTSIGCVSVQESVYSSDMRPPHLLKRLFWNVVAPGLSFCNIIISNQADITKHAQSLVNC